MERRRNERGFTLLEMLVGMAIVVVMAAAVFSITKIGNQTLNLGVANAKLHNDESMLINFITDKVRYATKLEVISVEEVPYGEVTDDYSYIYTEEKSADVFNVIYKRKGKEEVLGGTDAGDSNLKAEFTASGADKLLQFRLNGTYHNQKYDIASKVTLLNLISILDGNKDYAVKFRDVKDPSPSNNNHRPLGLYFESVTGNASGKGTINGDINCLNTFEPENVNFNGQIINGQNPPQLRDAAWYQQQGYETDISKLYKKAEGNDSLIITGKWYNPNGGFDFTENTVTMDDAIIVAGKDDIISKKGIDGSGIIFAPEGKYKLGNGNGKDKANRFRGSIICKQLDMGNKFTIESASGADIVRPELLPYTYN